MKGAAAASSAMSQPFSGLGFTSYTGKYVSRLKQYNMRDNQLTTVTAHKSLDDNFSLQPLRVL